MPFHTKKERKLNRMSLKQLQKERNRILKERKKENLRKQIRGMKTSKIRKINKKFQKFSNRYLDNFEKSIKPKI